MRTTRFAVGLVGLVAVLAACGVPSDSAPRDIPRDRVEYDLLAPATTVSPTSTPESTVTSTVYMLGADNHLKAVQRRVSDPQTVGSALASLIQGATTAEQASGLRSAINQQTAVLGAEVTNGVALVDVSDAFSGVGSQEQILALAQVVWTATEAPDVTGVQILLNSTSVEVPRGDGTLSSAPLTRADYQTLAPSS